MFREELNIFYYCMLVSAGTVFITLIWGGKGTLGIFSTYILEGMFSSIRWTIFSIFRWRVLEGPAYGSAYYIDDN